MSNGAGAEALVEPDMKPIRAQEFTLGADHELTRTMSVGVRYSHKWMDRTIEDVGIAVPGVGEVFYISNPGRGISENLLRDKAGCTTCPNQPIPKRVYDGVEFRLNKRLSNRWYMNTSYLWSRLYGNYSGLASSDENGRNSPSVNRFFDGQYMSFDQTGAPVYGPLGTDRPHQFKVQASYSLPWGTQAGVFYQLASGLPQQQQVTVLGVPVFNLGRNNMGRSPKFSQTDLIVSQRVEPVRPHGHDLRSERHQPVRSGRRDGVHQHALPRCDPDCEPPGVLRGVQRGHDRRGHAVDSQEPAVRFAEHVPGRPQRAAVGQVPLLRTRIHTDKHGLHGSTDKPDDTDRHGSHDRWGQGRKALPFFCGTIDTMLMSLLLSLVLSAGGPSTGPQAAAAGQTETKHLTVATSAPAGAVAPGTRVSLVIEVAPKPEMHVYAPEQKGLIPISLVLEPTRAVKAHAARFPKPEKFKPLDEVQFVYSKPFRIVQDVTVSATPGGDDPHDQRHAEIPGVRQRDLLRARDAFPSPGRSASNPRRPSY